MGKMQRKNGKNLLEWRIFLRKIGFREKFRKLDFKTTFVLNFAITLCEFNSKFVLYTKKLAWSVKHKLQGW